MTERRASGTSPAGRGGRRTSRSADSRPADSSNRVSGARRAPRRRSDDGQRRTVQRGRDRRRRSSSDSERTILGLSTGKAVILTMVVGALALTLAVPMRTYFTQRAEAHQLAQTGEQLAADISQLRAQRAQQEDPAYLIPEIRERLRMVFPGETPYIVQVPGIQAPERTGPIEPEQVPEPWYAELWHSLSGPASTPEGPR